MTTDLNSQNKLPETIVKRNGSEDRFDRSKISNAIYNALRATGEYKDVDINEFTGKLLKSVLRELRTRKEDNKLHVEDVQDIIENKLMDKGLHETARYFIKYRFLHKINREKIDGTTLVDCNQTIDEYVGFTDWRIKANSNTTYSNAGMVNNTAGKVIANYWLDKVYSQEEGAAHRNGDYHIHDLDSLSGYCFTGDTRVALLDGTNPTFTELVDMYGDGKPFWVISRDKDGNIVPGNAHHPRLIKKNAKLIEITISGGAKIVCTPDHEFMLRDGSYRQAQDLRSHESLMPFYSSKKGAGYVFVRDAKKGIAEYLHRIVGAWKDGITDMRGFAVHHINGNKCDNRPENLEVMADGEHRAMELAETMTTDVWKRANNARLQEYNRSEEKRRAISEFASKRERNEKGEFYNHTVVSKRYLEDLQDVYCLTVDEYENFALEAGVFVHNCAGWNLRALLNEGFNGVRSRVNSRPPKHFREALGQMANFLGILQSEWAGAQAFSSFDTFLAPYVFRDQLPYEEVKKAIRGFVYNLNVPSRWGQCVPTSYKCQMSDGSWKSVDELVVGDTINVFDITTGTISTDTLTRINKYDAKEKMHAYTGESGGYFEVTPNHRVVIKTENGYEIKESSAILEAGASVRIPTPSGEEKYTVKEVTPSCDTVWCPTTNTGTFVCMTDEGYVFITGNSPFTNVTIDWTVPQDLKEQFPTRSDDHIFADIVDNEELMAIAKERGVESLEDMCYKHFQPEMDIIQKAYYEVMTEGDSTGQPFTFPIPTVNITEDFDWEGKNVPILFENAAKIGSSYFQNFVGSQYKIDENGNRVEDEEAYKPSAVRSMCPLTLDTEVLTDKGNVSMKDLDPAIHKIYSVGGVVRWNSFTKSPVYTDSTVYKITFENGVEVEMSSEHLQPILDESGERNVVARDLQPGMRCLFISNPDTEKMLGGESQITSVEKVGVKATQCIQVDSDKEEDSIFVLANGLVTHNCRLQLDLNELRKRGNGLFGSAESTGSTGVVTINLARLGYLYKGDKEGLYSRLNQLMDMAKSTLEKKRAIITDLFERGLYPYTKRYLPGGFNNHFSTIGVNGGNEMIRNFTNDEHDITTEWGQNFAEELLNHIRARLKKYQNETGNLYNLEASPSEGCLVYDTEVLTIDGPQKIGDLCDSQVPLLSFNNKTKQMEYKKASVFLDSVTEKVYKLTFDNGLTVECTSEHPFAVVEGDDIYWSPASTLKVDDFIGGTATKDTAIKCKVVSIEVLHKQVKVYNATVEDNQNFYVGNEELGYVLTHNTTYRFAREDLKRYPDIIQAGCKEKGQMYYTNSTQLPSWYTHDLFKALKMQDKLQTRYTGGCVEAGNYVITDRGRILIDELCNNKEKYEGIKVISYNPDTKKSEWDLVTDFHKIDVSDKDKIRIKGNASLDITTSDWHPFFVVTPEGQVEERRADELKPGDYLLQNSDTLVDGVCAPAKLTEDALWTLNVCGVHYSHEGGTVKLSDTRVEKYNVVQVTEVSKVDVEDNMFYDLTTEKNHNYLCGKLCYTFIHNTVFHMYMNEAVSSSEACRDIVRKVLTNFKMPYITVTPLFSVCDKHGYLKGQHDYCPICDEEIIARETHCCTR